MDKKSNIIRKLPSIFLGALFTLTLMYATVHANDNGSVPQQEQRILAIATVLFIVSLMALLCVFCAIRFSKRILFRRKEKNTRRR